MVRRIGGFRGNGSQVTRTGTPSCPNCTKNARPGGGSITDRYVDGLLKIAAHAIPAINDVEMAERARAGD